MTTATISPTALVSDLALEQPGRVTVFEQLGIDYCCGGRIPLADACDKRGLDLAHVLAALRDAPHPVTEELDLATVDVAALATHIVERHHAYLRAELPGLDSLVQRVARVHGGSNPRLHEVDRTYSALATALTQHMNEEERDVFPICLSPGSGVEAIERLRDAIISMESDHDDVAQGLERLRELTEGYAVPADACTSYRAMLQRLEGLERDVHLHVHKENNVLFPRALASVDADHR